MGGFLLGILLCFVFDGHRDGFVAVVFETPLSIIVTEITPTFSQFADIRLIPEAGKLRS